MIVSVRVASEALRELLTRADSQHSSKRLRVRPSASTFDTFRLAVARAASRTRIHISAQHMMYHRGARRP